MSRRRVGLEEKGNYLLNLKKSVKYKNDARKEGKTQ